MASDTHGPHGAVRPGGRTERNRLAVLHATLDELAGRGYARLTVDAVAERSGVHKTTVYRRWGSVDGLVAAALRLAHSDGWQAPDTGSLEGDLCALTRELASAFGDPESSALPTAAIHAAFQSAPAADALRAFYADRHERCAVVASRAVDRGELPPGTDPFALIRAACAPVFYRLFITREPVDDAVADDAAATAITAARNGAFERKV